MNEEESIEEEDVFDESCIYRPFDNYTNNVDNNVTIYEPKEKGIKSSKIAKIIIYPDGRKVVFYEKENKNIHYKIKHFDYMTKLRRREIDKNIREFGQPIHPKTLEYYSDKNVRKRRNKRIRTILIGRLKHRIQLRWQKIKTWLKLKTTFCKN